MISQDRLIKEEQIILNKVIEQLDNAMLKENRNLTKSKLEHKKAIETAKNFLKMGLSIEQVASGTGLTVEELRVLK